MALVCLSLFVVPVVHANDFEYREIEWTDLIPQQDYEALMNPPSYINDIEDGSVEDVLGGSAGNPSGPWVDDPYQNALVSTRVVGELNGENIRMPGFLVPLEFDNSMNITQFFLVPYFGACIHLPPPPPNQMVLVEYPQGFAPDSLFEPYWVEGKLSTQVVENEVGTSAYALRLDSYERYQ